MSSFFCSSKEPVRKTRPVLDVLEPRVLMSIVPAGALMVADFGTLGGKGAILAVTSNDTKTVVSSGAPFVDPMGIVEDVAGNLYVADSNAGLKRRGAIFKIDGVTGVRTLISQDTPSQGLLFVDPTGIALGADGQLYIADPNAGRNRRGAIIKVNPVTGVQTLISQNGPDFGTNFNDPTGIAIDANGNIIVADPNATPSGRGALIKVNPVTGLQSIISQDSPDLGPHFHNPTGLAIETNGNILVIDSTTGPRNIGAIVRVDPSTGIQTEISNGGKFHHPTGITIGSDGFIYVTQTSGFNGRGGIIKVDMRGSQKLVFSGKPMLDPFGILMGRDLSVTSSAIPAQNGIAGTLFSLDLTSFFVESDNTQNLSFSATLADGSALPAGLSVNASGILVGTPTSAGVYSIVATATDPAQQSATSTFSLTVIGPQLATIIPPPPLVITENGSGTLNVLASTNDNLSQISQVTLTGFPAGWTVDLAGLSANPQVVSAALVAGTLTVNIVPTFNLALPISMSPPVHNEAAISLSIGVTTIRQTGAATAPGFATLIVDAVAATPTVNLSIGAGVNFVVPVTVNANFTYPLDNTETDSVVVTLPAGFGLESVPAGAVFNAGNQTITFTQPIGASTLNAILDVVLPTSIIPASPVNAVATVTKINTNPLDTDAFDKTASASTSANIVDNEAATLINNGIGHDDASITDVTNALNAAKLKLAALGAGDQLGASLLTFIQSITNALVQPSVFSAQRISMIVGMIGGSASGVMEQLGSEAAKLDGNSLLSNDDNIVIQPALLAAIQVVNLGTGLAGMTFNQLTYPGRPIGFPDQSDGSYVGPASVTGNTVVFVIHGVHFTSGPITTPIAGGANILFTATNGDSVTLTNDPNPINDAVDLAAKIDQNVTSATYIQLDPSSLSYTGSSVISFSATPAGFVGGANTLTDNAGEVFSVSGLAFPLAPGTLFTLTSTTNPASTLVIKTGNAPVNTAGDMVADLNILFGNSQLAPALDRRIQAVLQDVGGSTSDNLQDQLNQLLSQTQVVTNPNGIFNAGGFAAVNQATDLSDRLTAFLALFQTNTLNNTITINLGASAPTNLDQFLSLMTDPTPLAIPASVSAPAAVPLDNVSNISNIVDNEIGHDDPAITDITSALNAAKSELIELGSPDVVSASLLAIIQSIDNALANPALSTAQQIPTLMSMLSSVTPSSITQALQADGAMLDGSNLLNDGTNGAPSLDDKINALMTQLMGNTSGNLLGDVNSVASQLRAATNPGGIFDPTAFAAAAHATSLSGQLNAFLALFNTTNCPQGTITITLGVTPPTTLQGLLDLMS
jgi:hypothetical protein